MDRLKNGIQETLFRNFMLEDDIVFRSKSRESVQTSLENRRHAFEKKGIKVSRNEILYMSVNKKMDGQLNYQDIGIKKEE